MGLFDWLAKLGPNVAPAYDPTGPVVVIVRRADLGLVDALRAAGKTVEYASHGEVGLIDRLVGLRPPAIVIGVMQDDGQPNGFLICKAIKGDARFSLAAVLLFGDVPGMASTFDQHQKLRSAADGYISSCEPADIARGLQEHGR
jgi:hypothetical protein